MIASTAFASLQWSGMVLMVDSSQTIAGCAGTGSGEGNVVVGLAGETETGSISNGSGFCFSLQHPTSRVRPNSHVMTRISDAPWTDAHGLRQTTSIQEAKIQQTTTQTRWFVGRLDDL